MNQAARFVPRILRCSAGFWMSKQTMPQIPEQIRSRSRILLRRGVRSEIRAVSLRKKGNAMFCGQCGNDMPETAQFCSSCGAPLKPGAPAAGWQGTTPQYGGPFANVNRLYRSRQDRMIAGVCSGLAQHYGWETSLVRIAAVLIGFFSAGTGILAYIVFWIVMPEEPWALPSTASGSVPPPPAF
jgi:phage shock protein C